MKNNSINEIDNISCKFCWEEIKTTAKKCKHCWEFLDSNSNQNNNTQPSINIINQQNTNLSNDGTNEKSWVVALLLSIFLPWIDRFYLWHWWLWVIKILTFLWFWLWYFIDIFLILTKSVWWVKWK